MATAQEGAELLALCREGHEAWPLAACEDAADKDGRWTDANAALRYSLLLALQYDLRPGDLALVRYLFQQETLRHRREPFQGLSPALPLAGYLLATFHAVEHVWLFAEARLANFDTHMGFDLEYLVSAGIKETLALVKEARAQPLRQTILEWLVREDGRCSYSEDMLASWWQRMRTAYPARPGDEEPKSRLDQALELGDLEAARRWLEVWEATLPRTAKHLHTVAWYWAQLEVWERAAAVAAEYLSHDDLNNWDRASMQVHAAGYYREAGQLPEALRRLAEARETLQSIESWWTVGLGRSALEEAMRTVLTLPPTDESVQEAYDWALYYMGPGIATLHLLELAEAAAAHRDDEEKLTRLGELIRRERRRIGQVTRRPTT